MLRWVSVLRLKAMRLMARPKSRLDTRSRSLFADCPAEQREEEEYDADSSEDDDEDDAGMGEGSVVGYHVC